MVKWEKIKEYHRKTHLSCGHISLSCRDHFHKLQEEIIVSLPDNLRHKTLEWNDNQRKALYSLYVICLFSIRNHRATIS